jgi:hypothetical protein
MVLTVPVMPNPWAAMLTLIRSSVDLPAALQSPTPADDNRVCATLPDKFPADLPILHVVQVPGGREDVRLRLRTALFDLHLYHVDLFTAMDQSRYVAAAVSSLEGRAAAECGFTVVRAIDVPFPLQDPDTGTERAVIPISATYRPV